MACGQMNVFMLQGQALHLPPAGTFLAADLSEDHSWICTLPCKAEASTCKSGLGRHPSLSIHVTSVPVSSMKRSKLPVYLSSALILCVQQLLKLSDCVCTCLWCIATELTLAARVLLALIQFQEPLQQPIFGLHHIRHPHTCRDLHFTCLLAPYQGMNGSA